MYRDTFQMDSYSSNLSRMNKIWLLDFFKNLIFHDNETHLLLAATIYFRRMTGIKVLIEFVSHLGKKLLLPELFEWTCRTHRKNDSWSCLKKVRPFFWFLLHERVCRHSTGYRRNLGDFPGSEMGIKYSADKTTKDQMKTRRVALANEHRSKSSCKKASQLNSRTHRKDTPS